MLKLKIALSGLVLITLSACATRPPLNYGPFPEGWRDQVNAYINSAYFDPPAIRDSYATIPFKTSESWKVCLRNNAKNRLGAYVGLTKVGLEIDSLGKIVEARKDDRDCLDGREYAHDWVPFPIKSR